MKLMSRCRVLGLRPDRLSSPEVRRSRWSRVPHAASHVDLVLIEVKVKVRTPGNHPSKHGTDTSLHCD